jgi:hypothetical protein
VWLPLVVVVAVAIGVVTVSRLHGIFGAHDVSSGATGQGDEIVAVNPKNVTYEVFGPAEAVGVVSYLDENAKSQRASFTTLPWSHTITTMIPGVFANVVAQGDADNIGCRIVVNGVVKDQQSASGVRAQTFCLDKAA